MVMLLKIAIGLFVVDVIVLIFFELKRRHDDKAKMDKEFQERIDKVMNAFTDKVKNFKEEENNK